MSLSFADILRLLRSAHLDATVNTMFLRYRHAMRAAARHAPRHHDTLRYHIIFSHYARLSLAAPRVVIRHACHFEAPRAILPCLIFLVLDA